MGNTTNGHLKLIKEGLLSYLPPLNALKKQKSAMRRAMRKPRDLLFKIFAARLIELNNYLPISPGSSAAKNMDSEELNKILLHVVPYLWAKQSYIQVWDFEGRSYKETCKMFERMETAETIYEGGSPSKNTLRAESDSGAGPILGETRIGNCGHFSQSHF